MPEHLGAVAVGGEHPRPRSRGQDVVEADEPELAGVGRGPGDDHAPGLEQGTGAARRWGPGAPPGRGGAAASARGSVRSTRASTAIGRPSTTISGLRSMAAMPGSASDRGGQPQQHVAERLAVDRGLAPERAEQGLGGQLVDHVLGVGPGERDQAHRPRRPPPRPGSRRRPSRTVGPNCGSRATPAMSSRLPFTMGATSSDTSPSSGVAAPSRSAPGPGHRVGAVEAEAHQPALGLVGDGVAAQLHHHREPEVGGRLDGLVGGGHLPLVEQGHPVASQQRLGGGLGQGAGGARVGHGGGPYRRPPRAPRPTGRRRGAGRCGTGARTCCRRASSASGAKGSRASRPSRKGPSLK